MEKSMKKFLTLFLIGILAFSFTACGKDSDKKNVKEDGQIASKESEKDKKPQKPLEAREFRDVVYDTHSEAQKLDLYLPETGEGPFPLVVFIHGGAWFGGDKADGQEAAWVTLRSQGYAVASINYRLSGEAAHPAGILDCKTAIRYLRANAEQYHLDEEHIAVAGDSAGGHYALMTALTEDYPDFLDLSGSYAQEDSGVCCVVAWYPMTDLETAWQMVQAGIYMGLGDDVVWSSLEDFIGEDIANVTQEKLSTASPIRYISEEMVPVLLQHGSADTICPVEQSRSFYREAAQVAGEESVQLDIMEGAEHGDPVFETPENMERIGKFLDKYMKVG